MISVGVRDLSRNTTRVVDEVTRSGKPTLVTIRGRPVAALVAIGEEEFEDFILSQAPEFVASMREAEEDLAAGRIRPASEFFDELDKEAS
ncbi:MAG: type II toxin-antitoxin system prevent-host-death family antitoxin [Candidatus Dormibacteraceae bacterium]